MRFSNGTENGVSTDSKNSLALYPEAASEELMAILSAILAAALEFKSQRGSRSSGTCFDEE